MPGTVVALGNRRDENRCLCGCETLLWEAGQKLMIKSSHSKSQSNHMVLLLLLLLSLLSRVRLCATPEMAAHQALLSLGFSRQEHWSGLPFPSPMRESEK